MQQVEEKEAPWSTLRGYKGPPPMIKMGLNTSLLGWGGHIFGAGAE